MKFDTYDEFKEIMMKKYPVLWATSKMISDIVVQITIARNNLEWSQKELAKNSNISYRKIKRLEECYNGIKLRDLIKIIVSLKKELKVLTLNEEQNK